MSPPNDCSVVGVLLAAGRGRRMGTTKQLLPWPHPHGTSTVVAAAFDVIAPVCGHVFIVLGHEAEAVERALGDRARTAVHADSVAPMCRSVQAGLHAALATEAEVLLLHLADTPNVKPQTVRAVLDACDRSPGVANATLPEYRGKGGHPVAISRSMAEAIAEATLDDGGLRAFWERHRDQVQRLPVDDSGVVRDFDTPADLDRS